MAQPAWITYPQIEDLNSGRTTRDANTRLINNLTAMFGTTPNEFLTTSNVEFANVTAVTFVGDGSGLTGIGQNVGGGVINAGSLSLGADSDANGIGVIVLQTRGSTRLTIENLGTTFTLPQNTNWVIPTGTTNGFSIDGTTFSVDALNKRVGVGTDKPDAKVDISTDSTGGTVESLIISNTGAASTATKQRIHITGKTTSTTRNILDLFASYSDITDGTRTSLVEFKTDDNGSPVDTMIFQGGRVGFGLAPLPNMGVGDVLLEGGSLVLKEIITPTADDNYGKIYTKSDNALYFQDGAGVEHTVTIS